MLEENGVSVGGVNLVGEAKIVFVDVTVFNKRFADTGVMVSR
jgi:hypothetical protein